MDNTELTTESSFKIPYYIEELAEDGLTSRDLAESLQIPIKHVHQRMNRSFIEKTKLIQSWRMVTNVTTINSDTYAEKDGVEFSLNTRAAKAFVATYNNAKGAAYLDFLFDCEHAATEILPRVMANLREITEKLAAAEEAVIKSDRKLLSASKKGMILAPIYKDVIFGLELVWEMRNKEELTPTEQGKAKMEHIQRTMEGLVARMRVVQKAIDSEALKSKNKLLAIAKQA